MRRALLLLILCVWPVASQAGLPGPLALQYRYQAWSRTQGLPQTIVLSIVQDNRGFIWAGTQSGLARFDGATFKTFTHRNTPALVDSYINALLSHDGTLWIGTPSGVSVYAHGQMKAVTSHGKSTGTVYAFAAVNDTVYAATGRGLFRIGASGSLVKVAGSPDQALASIAVTPEGALWVGGKGGVWARLAGQSRFRFHPLPDDTATARALTFWQGDVWAGTQAGLYRFNGDQATKFSVSTMAEQYVGHLLVGPRGGLWVGTRQGLFRINQQERLQDFRLVPKFDDDEIRSLAFDREGNIWVGAPDHGLVRLRDYGVASFGENVGLKPNTTTWGVYREPDGRIWIGTNTGIYEVVDGRLVARFDTSKLPSSVVTGFLRVGKDLLIGTLKGVARARDGKLGSLPPALTRLPPSLIYSLSPARGDGVWIGTSEGLYRWKGGALRQFGEAEGITEDRIRGVVELADGSVWVASEHGLFIGRDGHFKSAGGAAGIDGKSIQNIGQTSDGAVWLVSRSNGIARYKNGRFAHYGDKAGFTHGLLFGIRSADHGNVWVTGKGIYRLRIADLDRYDAGEIEQLPERLYNVPGDRNPIGCNGGGLDSIMMDPAGNLWCPATGAVVVLDTRHPPRNARPPPVAIEQVKAGNHAHVAARGDNIVVPPGPADLHFTYAGLSFENIKQVRYRYRLIGYDKHWIDAGTRRQAFYTNLSPGHYVFKVKARNSDGVWSDAPATFALTLKPFFYQTNWFRAIVALLVALLLYGLYYWRTRQTRARQLALEATVARRTTELSEANERLASTSVTDALTGLKNRRHLHERIGDDLAIIRRAYNNARVFPNDDIAFLMIDIDGFKHINDTYGHQAGDAFLVEVGNILTARMRDSDYVVRWGGEEFLVVARNSESTQASSLAERLRQALDRPFDVGGGVTIRGTCSIGFCAYPLTPRNLDQPGWEGIVALADVALYKAKAAGKNAWFGVRGTELTRVDWSAINVRRDFDRLVADGELVLETLTESLEA